MHLHGIPTWGRLYAFCTDAIWALSSCDPLTAQENESKLCFESTAITEALAAWTRANLDTKYHKSWVSKQVKHSKLVQLTQSAQKETQSLSKFAIVAW